MACILHIETATEIGSFAISKDGDLQHYDVSTTNFSHSASMGRFVEAGIHLLDEEGLKPDAVAISEGPGSYTGLRIGVSLAKGLCFGFDIPLIAIPTLKIMTAGLFRFISREASVFYCPMIDARRMEVYSAIYDENLTIIRPVQADIITTDSFREYLSRGKALFFGNGSDKCKTVIDSANAVFVDKVYPEASAMIELADIAYANREFVDLAYFEPFYLKSFQATVPKNKIIPTVDIPVQIAKK
ncbi:MAG: tRNA (adenosine(37)-N6)-threonylcarbamoyltransferase complex dimerization subunit type 1 TsaB [Dysgonamonadaceae bacterium]|jgi:tRNA threonylcarbamoyladenosine biosynthesis protein TsaB|nr:tRNA (adenosine(37)-N6)-threonylcarbamoyltransferase complex dimerization subunit type 1 TsaB [Dysgonamonadaceae bacterium]